MHGVARRRAAASRIAVCAAALVALLAVALPASAAQPQEIRISSILYGVPDPASPSDPNAFAISGCFAVTGAVEDSGGEPQLDAAGDIVGCESGAGISGHARFVGLGHLKTGEPNVIRASHRMFGRHGTIDISFEGKYGPIEPVGTPPDPRLLATTGVGGGWQITCGTGDYQGLQGVGRATAVADFTDAFAGTGPVVVVHIDTGRIHYTGSPSGCA